MYFWSQYQPSNFKILGVFDVEKDEYPFFERLLKYHDTSYYSSDLISCILYGVFYCFKVYKKKGGIPKTLCVSA